MVKASAVPLPVVGQTKAIELILCADTDSDSHTH